MTPDPGGNVGQLRRRNTGLVLAVLRRGPATRTDLARRTGLAKATVGSIIADLEANHLVAETGERTTGRGRPGLAVGLTGTNVVGMGFEVNIDYVTAVALDVSGSVVGTETVPIASGRDPLDAFAEVAEQHSSRLRSLKKRVVGVSVAVPGLVDSNGRTVRWTTNLGWNDLDMAAVVREATGLRRVSVENDANCAAVAEVNHGVARGSTNMIYLTGTVGIGAGRIVDGELQRGVHGFAGEVGHIPLGAPQARCSCGRTGCWEASIGVRAMLHETGFDPIDADPIVAAEAVARRAGTDATVAHGLEIVGSWLGRGLATIVGMNDPGLVVLGGYFVPLAEWILPAAEDAFESQLSFAQIARPEIRLSSMALRAAAIGAADNALADLLAGGDL